jgi:FMN-dependent NADH-azoreductase
MYNKSAPSTFKAYIDNIARAGRTFRYTAQGSVGLLESKKAFVLTTRGGFYQGTARDVETPWLVEILQLIGISDVDFVFAEGLNVSPEQNARAIAAAEAEIRALVERAV